MLERRTLGDFPPRAHSLWEHKQKKAYELVITRDGFSGGFSLLYGPNPPTAVNKIYKVSQPFVETMIGKYPQEEEGLSRRHVLSQNLSLGSSLFDSRCALFSSKSCRLSTFKGKWPKNEVFCNADADELWFVHEGKGQLLTMFGALDVKPLDYVLIPRGIPYFWNIEGDSVKAFITEGNPYLGIPLDFINPQGQLKLEAPYSHRDFRSPERLLNKDEAQLFLKISTLRNHTLTQHDYSLSMSEIWGWDGSIYPIAFNILNYLPKTGRVHLPPNLHLTFRGKDFVVCSFVPRMVDYEPNAIPCPYPHANVACDEVIYYVSGEFTSRKGIGPGSLSYHPYGIPHGPQPGKYFASVGAQKTDEIAVMIDTWEPLKLSEKAITYEDKSYPLSWIKE